MPDFALLVFIINKRNRLRSTILVAQYFKKELYYFPFCYLPTFLSTDKLNNIKLQNRITEANVVSIYVITTKIFCTLTYYINIDIIIIHNIHQLISTTIEHSMVMMQGI